MEFFDSELLKLEGATQLEVKKYEFLSTGHAGINFTLSGNFLYGVPLGAIIEIFGPEGIGKSTLVYKILAEAQKKNLIPVLIDIENSFTPAQALRSGLDTTKVISCKHKDLVRVVKFISILLQKLAERKQKGVIVWDSYAATRLDSKSSSGGMAEEARIVSSTMKELLQLTHEANTSLIIINQMRENVKGGIFSSHIQPGGWALKHGAHIRIELKKASSQSKLNKIVNEDEGKVVTLDVVKSKFFYPISTEFILLYKHGIDWHYSLISELFIRGILPYEGGWFEWGGKKYRRAELWNELRNNPEMTAQFEELLLKSVPQTEINKI